MSNWQTNDIIDFFKYHNILENKYLDFLIIHKINGNLMNNYLESIIKDMGLYHNITIDLREEIINHWNLISLKEISPNFSLKSPKV